MSTETCGVEYERPGGRQPGDRIVRCGLPPHDEGEHVEIATRVAWPQSPKCGEEIAPPLPPQPEVGSWVEWVPRDPSRWPIALQRRQETRDGEVVDRWWSAAGDRCTWDHLCAMGHPHLLHRDGAQRRYEPARDGRGLLWRHSCGRVSLIADHRDPTADPSALICVDDCRDHDGRWVPLYVEAGQSGG